MGLPRNEAVIPAAPLTEAAAAAIVKDGAEGLAKLAEADKLRGLLKRARPELVALADHYILERSVARIEALLAEIDALLGLTP